METKHRDVANAGGTIYDVIFSAASFVNVHDQLLSLVTDFIGKSPSKRLLVLGPGPLGSPYHRVPETVNSLFAGHESKLVLLDYNPANLAECFIGWHRSGMLDNLDSQVVVSSEESRYALDSNGKVNLSEYLRSINVAPEDVIKVNNPGDLENKVTFMEHDLREPLPNLGEFDVVDASYALHHIASYVQVLEARVQEVASSLRPNGMFHIGTGFADMSYSEKKIGIIAREIIKENERSSLTVVDSRNPSVYSVNYGSAGNMGLQGEIVGESIAIDSEGYVFVPEHLKCDKFTSGTHMGISGYNVFPLIDPRNEADVKGLIIPVYDFYFPTNVEIANITPHGVVTPELIQEAVTEDRLERHNAERGLVEYYMPESVWIDLLQEFEKVDIHRPNSNGKGFEELVNIAAYR